MAVGDAAYLRAEKKIKAALRAGSEALDLSSNRDDLEKLTALPKSLGDLVQLTYLDLSGNRLRTLPSWLANLTNLQNLEISNNQLKVLPDWIGDLTQLGTLGLAENQLKILPESLGRLKWLHTLTANSNHLSTLPASFGGLVRLQWLYLYTNEFSVMPDSVCQLPKLERLYLYHNQLTTLPKALGQMKKLKELDLEENRLQTLPEELQQLKSLRELYLHGNPDLGISDDVLGPRLGEISEETKPTDPSAILAFYFGQRKQSAKPLNEVKLLLVGHGRVGKTSLSKALRGLPHDVTEPETPGIERHALELMAVKSKITAHIWDFGGQEFLHQTHQFFFSKRSIYVVVLTGRQGRPMQEAEYWLRLIRTYGTGSPVVIALNQIEAHPFDVDEHFLIESYPEIQGVVKTDCDPRIGIEPLLKLIGKLAGGMPSVREKIDPAWSRVRARLEDMKESFVTFPHYREICVEEGVKAAETQDNLATILDCLGIALNYRNDARLRDTTVLKPRWLVDGIYSILRWLHKNETNGEMRLADIPKALTNKKLYPPDMHEFLLALMEKFELCFPLDSEKGLYLVPGLLNANQPLELKKFATGKARRLQFRYEDVRPPGMLPRFIVRSHTLSEGQPRWVRGVVLARGTARALVRGDHEGRVTDVFALGEDSADRVWLTEFILSEMRVLNDKLPVRTFVESESQSGVWSELEVLREEALRPDGTRSERAADGSMVLINAKETLRQVESAEASKPGDNALSLFICYAHDDERIVRELIPSLKVLARRGYIAPWRDTDLVPGEDWDATIKERLSKSQIILFMVSTHFLASDYITENEVPLAMSLMNKQKAVVVPVLLSPCSWDEEDFEKLEKLPRKDAPVSSFRSHRDAWFLVEEGLKKVVVKARGYLEHSMADLSRMRKHVGDAKAGLRPSRN